MAPWKSCVSDRAWDVGHDSADFRPTDQQLEVHRILTARLEEVREEYTRLMEEDVPELRAMFLGTAPE